MSPAPDHDRPPNRQSRSGGRRQSPSTVGRPLSPFFPHAGLPDRGGHLQTCRLGSRQGLLHCALGAINNARAYQSEQRRAEALAELDRAKTAFFSNVSHELRTPLTLMLGPLEEELRLRPQNPSLEVAHRNSLRLLKLVNTLLDFSRIEAGRTEACYQPTDLAAYSADLASGFRSAVEKAGVTFIVECPPLPDAVYVDRTMWEQIVLYRRSDQNPSDHPESAQ